MKPKQSVAAVALVCAGMFFLAQAQNARIDALGGAFIVPDFSRTLYNPAIMNDYKNHAEITFNAGAIMGTKSSGSVFSFGAMMNRGLMLRYFYSGAGAELNYPPYIVTPAAGIPGAANMQYFPHLLWGIDLATVQIGFDAFLEWDRVTYHSTIEVPGAFQQIDEELTISHPGLMAGFTFNLNSLTILFHMGGGMPRATGTVERTNIAPIGIAKIETESGLFARGGLEITASVNQTDFVFGADGRYEQFQFSQLAPLAGAQKDRSNKIDDKTATPYLGVMTRLANDFLFVAMGRSAIDILTSENDAGTASTTLYELRHALIGGGEKQFKKPWKFDSLALR
ncbi:MAG: hypothetical protein JXA71_11935, partial [Chitinispirillaceae bacterium]|nr:hypothetical protein [Chitinispirillaceae bacterium]